MDIDRRLGHSSIPPQVALKNSSQKRRLPPIRLKPKVGSSLEDLYQSASPINVGGLGLSMANLVDPSHPVYERKIHTQMKHKVTSDGESRATNHEPDEDKDMNPEPVPFAINVFNTTTTPSRPPLDRVRVNGIKMPPYKPHVFQPLPPIQKPGSPADTYDERSSTMIKKVSVPPRHSMTWGSASHASSNKRIIMHTDRYQFEGQRGTPDSLPTPLGHYDPCFSPMSKQFLIDGQQAVLFERMDITDELRQLKSIVLPKKAKDLYVGRGFQMPHEHAINKPRPPINHPMKSPTGELAFMSPRVTLGIGKFPPTIRIPKFKKNKMPSRTPQRPLGKPPSSMANTPRLAGLENVVAVKVITPGPLGQPPPVLAPPTSANASPNHLNLPPSPPVRQKTSEAITDYNPPPEPEPKPVSPPPIDASKQEEAPVKQKPKRSRSPGPLASKSLRNFLSDDEYSQLQNTFKKLDTDQDGNLTFPQVKSQFPGSVTSVQERFIKHVYDETGSNTFFGLEEFVAMTLLITDITMLSEPAQEAIQSLDHGDFPKKLKQFTSEFHKVNQDGTEEISTAEVAAVIESVKDAKLPAAERQKITDIFKSQQDKVNKFQFLAHVPFFLSLKGETTQVAF